MARHFRYLGSYSDWVDEARKRQPLFPLASPGPETQRRLRQVLGFSSGEEQPREPSVEQRWERDGLRGEAVSWSVGYGPRTQAWVFKPTSAAARLPGVVALHDHGGFKFYGKEKISDGPGEPAQLLLDYRQTYYGGRAYVEALAREGFVVLVHDTFLWGSRRFLLECMPPHVRAASEAIARATPAAPGTSAEIADYNIAAAQHEHWIAKYCNLLGTSLAGMVSYEDRVAINYLRSRADVRPERIGCIGLSGGGNRAALLQATHDSVAAAVIVGLMTTYDELLDCDMSHTWMMFPPGWARYGDWPDIAACRAPSPLLVQYDLQDELFTEAGMRAAHQRLAAHYASVDAPQHYSGEFYAGPHKFDLEMQARAFDWLTARLGDG